MSDQNKEQQTGQTPEPAETGNGAEAAAPSGWSKLLGKRWIFPAIYMVAAAIILSLIWTYQNNAFKKADDPGTNPGTVINPAGEDDGSLPATAPTPEPMRWPVVDYNELQVLVPYYDENGTNDVKQAALVEYGETIVPHVGIDFAQPDNQTFDVLAALSGTVTTVEKHALVGDLVEITHDNGLVTVYQSLSDVQVSVGDEVKQGDVIAKAGRNELEKDLGVHLHFEVRQNNGLTVNPEDYIAPTESTSTDEASDDHETATEPAEAEE